MGNEKVYNWRQAQTEFKGGEIEDPGVCKGHCRSFDAWQLVGPQTGCAVEAEEVSDRSGRVR